ncbi:immunoglobulin-like domain-containing protein [Bacillus infantis]|uniref:immunoglobulin-like domain-containing protein n=1 Tax=Bacillus infantis TaxID=324767 RepID=UPI003CF4371A
MKRISAILCVSLLLLSGCQESGQSGAASGSSDPKKLDEQSQFVEDAPRFVGEFQENILDKYTNKVRNLQNGTGTYDYFIQDHFYGDGNPVPVQAGGTFKGFTVPLEPGQKLIVELGKWDKFGRNTEKIDSRTTADGGDTAVSIPQQESTIYYYRLAVMDASGKILKENYFPLYTPSEENHMIATASKSVYKKGETASIYYENWAMHGMETGSAYGIYKQTSDGWEPANKGMAFTDILIIMSPSSIKTEHINLAGLEEGNYKVLKSFSREGETGNRNVTLGVEFKIKGG